MKLISKKFYNLFTKLSFIIVFIFITIDLFSSETPSEKKYHELRNEWCSNFGMSIDNPIFAVDKNFCNKNSSFFGIDSNIIRFFEYYSNRQNIDEYLANPFLSLIQGGFYNSPSISSNINYTTDNYI